ncbi:MAG: TonB-dependent receptor [Acidobacteriota bacterium]|nr:TonB-dependent receptor [Acidobacteriota bacterium]
MPWFGLKAISGLLFLSMLPALLAQTKQSLTVLQPKGDPVVGARVADGTHQTLGFTDVEGVVHLSCPEGCLVNVQASGFISQQVKVSGDTVIHMTRQPKATEEVTVTAYREPIGQLESPVTTRVLTQKQLLSSATITLDDQLRQLPGVETFRRSSSLVANPTSQGISLRGLGSTSASRTLVTEDDIPLNDPIGGWIHWQEQPDLTIQSVEVMRGGASDLYGSSAIGGVIHIIPVLPTHTAFALNSSYGGEGTYDTSALGQTKHGPWGALFSAGVIGTDGYIQYAPWLRGPVDIPSNVHSQSGVLLLDHTGNALRIFVRGSGFNESRGNGTPYQANGTRLWRYLAGVDWQSQHNDSVALRVYGSTEHYRQTFSAISSDPKFGDPTCTSRCGEIPTKFTLVPANELGAAAHWSRPFGAHLVVLAGSDVHDLRIWDSEESLRPSPNTLLTADHQRDTGMYAQVLGTKGQWTATTAGRIDWFQNFDGNARTSDGSGWTPAANQPPQWSQAVFNPRIGISRKLGDYFAVSASAFRAFRAPTPSELYRNTQVGNKLTLANGALLSERATGWETGVASERRWGTVRISYFLTQVNRPITAVTINPTSSPILLKRQNLGQIESRGISIDFEVNPWRFLQMNGGYQYAHATVTKGQTDVGNWIPEVARNMATLNLRASSARFGTLSLQSRLSGRQYDDDANLYPLHGYFRLDAHASRNLGPHLEIFTSGENLFDRQIEVSKTPSTTLGQPRTARAGIRLLFGNR